MTFHANCLWRQFAWNVKSCFLRKIRKYFNMSSAENFTQRFPRSIQTGLEAQVGKKSLTWIRLMMICCIIPWWPSWLSDQIAFSNPESDVVWRVSRLPPWLQSWILELNDLVILNLHITPMPPIKFRLNLTYRLGGDVVWRISRWPSWILEQNNFSNSEFP